MNKVLFLCLFISFYSCIKKEQKDTDIIKIDISEAIDLELDELVKEINIIPLETNDSCLIHERNTMQIRNGNIYINNNQKEVLQFNPEGQFIKSSLSLRGQGPKEYIFVHSSFVDEEDVLGIYEIYFSRIQEYGKQWTYQQSVKIEVPDTRSPQLFRSYIKLNDSIYIVKDFKDIHFYSVKQGRTVKSIHHEFPDLLAQMTQLQLTEYNGKFHYSHSYSCDTLFCIDEKDLCLKPELIFDFLGKSFNIKDLPFNMPAEYYLRYLLDTDKIVVLEKINLPNRKFCYFLEGKKSYVSYTTNRGTTIFLKNKKNPFPTPHAIENNTFYNLVWPEKLKEYINTELVDNESLKRIQHIKDDDNPILVCYKLR